MIGLLRKPLSTSDKVERKFETISNNSFGPLGAQNNYFSATSQTLLTGVESFLRCRLGVNGLRV